MTELEKGEKKMLVMGKLTVRSDPADETKGTRKKQKGDDTRIRCSYHYHFDHRSVCQTVFMKLHDLTIHILKALQRQATKYGPTPRTHKLKGKK